MSRPMRFLTKWRYVHLFFALMCLIGLVPFIGNILFIDVALGVVLLSSLIAVGRHLLVRLSVVVIYFLSQAMYFLPDHIFHNFLFVKNILNTAWLLPVAVLITKDIITSKDVYKDMIFGGLCVYLFLGFIWGELYTALLRFDPGCIAFTTSLESLAKGPLAETHMTYYSFVTLTTLGFGDIVPVTEKAMALTVLESVCGQLFLAVFIASLVGRLASGQARRQISELHSERPRRLE